MNIQSLYRYPVKGLSPETLASVDLHAAQGFPLDRAYAVTDGSLDFDPAHPVPAPKTQFLMLAKYEKLARLKTRFVESSAQLELAEDGRVSRFDLADDADRKGLADYLQRYLDVPLPGTPRVVNAPNFQFTDVSVRSEALMRSISLINLDTVADFARHLDHPLDPLRFRANLYFSGQPAWTEMEWVDRELTIGDVVLKVVRRTKRCAATSVDPQTGIRDLNIPVSLLQYVKHGDLGIYAEVVRGGTIRPGDELVLRDA
ncbi:MULTISPECIES: MOSC domain-containing protein [Cupriavidus]|jgi:hypothetical protein|uniref:MOSC domain-containing protein n=1 Tax=Cupriavidus pauculus TaxID=82633 RepID=A0A5P2HEU9_9BURK|nr:MOSC domain-containing protein [Cupriavidus pauculus]QET06124.1 MOSC domain-containing protein [Cupriavidus pauculus]